jgi:ADP-ribose pyrophosphatase
MPSDFTEKKLASRTAYAGRLLHVNEDEVELPDGGRARREYILHPGAVVIIPLLDEDTLLVEHQYRYALQRHFLELPAGKIEAGEPAAETARRELLEETGYLAQRWEFLTTLHPCVGYSDERIELFLARDLRFEGHPGEDDEFIETLELPIDQALEKVFAGEITELKTILGVFWADRLRRTP